MYIPPLLHPLTQGGAPRLLPALAVVHSAAANVGVQTPFQVSGLFPSDGYPEVELLN